ncbi:MAG: STAS domain-containing protein [Microcoleaceae cyanobacterium]
MNEEGVIPEQLKLTVSLRGTRDVKDNYQLFRLNGLLDAFSEQIFKSCVERCIAEGPKNIILDLSKIDFLDSSGLGVLVKLVKQVQGEGGTLQVIANVRVMTTVKLVRLEEFLSVRESVDAAIANVK